MSVGAVRFFLGVLAACLLSSEARALSSDLSTSDIAVLQEMYHLWSSKADNIWPTAAKTQIPTIYIKADTEYAVGFPKAVQGFNPVIPAAGFEMPVQARSRTFATDLSASFPVDDIAAVVIASPDLLKKPPEEWVIIAEHEMFHVFQSAHGGQAKIATLGIASSNENASWQLNFPFPYSDKNVMRLIHLQGYPLWLAANSKDNGDAKYNIGTTLDAVDVYRWSLGELNPKNYLYSEFQEWSEGVAKYTEYRFAECAAQPDYTPAQLFRSLPGYKGYADLWKTNYQNTPYLIKHAGRATQSRTAFYHLGMGKALALDRVKPDWKKQYFTHDVWLDDLLRISLDQSQ